MSTVAAARVETKIVLQGEGNAARVVKDTRDQLDGMGASAEKATAASASAFGAFAAKAQQTMGRVGASVAGINAVLGGTTPTLQKVGQGFTAAAAVANVLPGPIGLAAAAITGLATGAYAFAKAAAEAEAKSTFLRGGGGENLATALGVSQDAALQMAGSMEDLAKRGLAPSNELMSLVRDRVVAMGGDGEKAVIALVEAINKGPDALRDFQKTAGNLNLQNLADTAQALGLSKETLGLAKEEVDDKKQINDLATQYNLIQAERKAKEDELAARAKADNEAFDQSIAARIERGKQLGDQRDAYEKGSGAIANERERQLKAEAAAIEERQSKLRAAKSEEVDLKQQAEELDVRAAGTANKQLAADLQIEAVNARLAAIDVQRNELALIASTLGEAELAQRQKALDLETLKLTNQITTIDKVAQADKKAKAAAGAGKAKERIQAETDATIKLAQAIEKAAEARAKDTATDPAVLAERLKVINLEEAAAVRAAKSRTNTAKGREAELKAIEIKNATERDAIQKTFDKATADRQQKAADLRQALAEEALQTELDAQAKIDELTKAQTVRETEAMRARGDFHGAMLADIAAAELAHATAVEKINRDLAIALTGIDKDSDAAAKQRQLAQAQLAAEQQKLAQATTVALLKQTSDVTAKFKEQISIVDESTRNALDASATLIQSNFGKAVEAKQNAIEQLKSLQESAAGLSDQERVSLDAQVKAQEKVYQGQIKGLQDRAKQAEKTIASMQTFGKGLAGIVGGAQKASVAMDQFNAASAAGNIEAMSKANDGLSSAIDGTITASGAAAAAFVEDEKTKAAILALTETAASVAAFATGNVAGGIAHGAAAAIYAGVAGGAIGGSAGGTATGGATTGGGGTVSGQSGQTGGGGSGVTQVFNFNKGFVIGSAQEVGKGLNGTLNSVMGTGYDRRKAA